MPQEQALAFTLADVILSIEASRLIFRLSCFSRQRLQSSSSPPREPSLNSRGWCPVEQPHPPPSCRLTDRLHQDIKTGLPRVRQTFSRPPARLPLLRFVKAAPSAPLSGLGPTTPPVDASPESNIAGFFVVICVGKYSFSPDVLDANGNLESRLFQPFRRWRPSSLETSRRVLAP